MQFACFLLFSVFHVSFLLSAHVRTCAHTFGISNSLREGALNAGCQTTECRGHAPTRDAKGAGSSVWGRVWTGRGNSGATLCAVSLRHSIEKHEHTSFAATFLSNISNKCI